jgi:hypothetical protein
MSLIFGRYSLCGCLFCGVLSLVGCSEKPLDTAMESDGAARRLYFLSNDQPVAGVACSGDGAHSLDVFAVLDARPKDVTTARDGRVTIDGHEQPMDLAVSIGGQRFASQDVEVRVPKDGAGALAGDVPVTDALATALRAGGRLTVGYGRVARTAEIAPKDAPFMAELVGHCAAK